MLFHRAITPLPGAFCGPGKAGRNGRLPVADTGLNVSPGAARLSGAGARSSPISAPRRWWNTPCAMARACFRPMVRWWSKPASTQGAAPRTSSFVRDAETENTVWWGKTNVAMTPEQFAVLKADFIAAMGAKDKLYVADLFGGSQADHRVNVRVITEFAWHNAVRAHAAGAPHGSGAGQFRARIHDHRSAQLPRRSRRATAAAAKRLSRSTSPRS